MIGLALAMALASTTADDIARAHELVGRLACDEGRQLGEQIATRPFADEAEQREGFLIAGYCLAAVGRVGDAEELFRAAVTEDVRIEAGFPMERRVQYLLDAARADVVLARAQRAAEQRAALAAQVTLVVLPPRPIVGGQRASFVVRVEGAAAERVRSVTLEFRRPDDPEFYRLPVRRGDDGIWRGEIGGIYTGSTKAYDLTWFVTASDEVGQLTTSGSREAPLSLQVAAGSNLAEDLRARERLPPVTRLLFAGIGAPTAVGLSALATVAVAAGIDSFNPLGRPANEKLLGIVALLAVPVSMVATETATTVFLLDGPSALLPAIAVGVVAGLGDIAILIAMLRGASLVELYPFLDANAPVITTFQIEGAATIMATLLGVGTASVVPLVMVAWDASHEAE